jgi:hypothetical protein
MPTEGFVALDYALANRSPTTKIVNEIIKDEITKVIYAECSLCDKYETIEHILKNHHICHTVMFWACYYNVTDVIELVQEYLEGFEDAKIAQVYNWGLEGACESNWDFNCEQNEGTRFDLIDKLIRDYNKLENSHFNIDLNYGLYGACYGGHIDVFLYMLEKCDDLCETVHFNACLKRVSNIYHKDEDDYEYYNDEYSDQLEIAKILLSRGAFYPFQLPLYAFKDMLCIYNSFCHSIHNHKIIYDAIIYHYPYRWSKHLDSISDFLDNITCGDIKDTIIDYYDSCKSGYDYDNVNIITDIAD